MASKLYTTGVAELHKASGEVLVIKSKVHAFVAAHPAWAMLIAFGIGFVVGHIRL